LPPREGRASRGRRRLLWEVRRQLLLGGREERNPNLIPCRKMKCSMYCIE
jgi:hypothetical protein